MKKETFGEFLRKKRKEQNLSQFQLGRLIGATDKAVSRWENNSNKPRSVYLMRISTVFNIDVKELLEKL